MTKSGNTAAPHQIIGCAIKDERISEVRIIPVRVGNPITSVIPIIVKRRPNTPTGCRKKDGIAVRPGDFVTVAAFLCCPFPCTFIYKLLHLNPIRKSPCATPDGT